MKKRILLVDDEQGFLEPLSDALESENVDVQLARSASEAIKLFRESKFDAACVDVMLPAGPELQDAVGSQEGGVHVLDTLRRENRALPLFCLSVVSDEDLIRRIQRLNVTFLRKGETPLRTVLSMIMARLTGVAYRSD